MIARSSSIKLFCRPNKKPVCTTTKAKTTTSSKMANNEYSTHEVRCFVPNSIGSGLNPLQCIKGEGLRSRSKSEKERSREIDRQLIEIGRQEKSIVKLLLLGQKEAGKSTLVKQMKIIHNDGFSADELLSFKPTVRHNLVASVKYVLMGMSLLKIRLGNSRNKKFAEMVLNFDRFEDDEYFSLYSKIGLALDSLWRDKGFQLAAARGFEYQLNDSALYFFDNIERICSEDFMPTTMDVLKARVRTLGIIETHFRVNQVTFQMIDVGGQKSNRRKWIQVFDNVTAILFVVALSDYDLCNNSHSHSPYENMNGNRSRNHKNSHKRCVSNSGGFAESLELFSEICNNKYFWNTTTVLFLNKMDLFREKIHYTGRHLRFFMSDYEASGQDFDVDAAALFIQKKFRQLNANPSKAIHTHFTTATDTSNIQAVFETVSETITRVNLKESTFL